MSEIQVIKSDDGSHTLFVPSLNETYHSTHGAVQESRHVFVQAGLAHLVEQGKQDISILEIGFGTGLNALLSYEYLKAHPEVSLAYHSLEAYLVPQEIATQLNYPELADFEGAQPFFEAMHSAEWNQEIPLNEQFTLHKIHQKLEDWSGLNNQVDLVYFDAFAPSRQADMWTLEQLEKVKNQLKSGGVLVTYCANGQFKRNLKALGFELEMLDGPKGKREMTRGTMDRD